MSENTLYSFIKCIPVLLEVSRCSRAVTQARAAARADCCCAYLTYRFFSPSKMLRLALVWINHNSVLHEHTRIFSFCSPWTFESNEKYFIKKNYIYGQSPLNDAVEFSAKHTELASILGRNAISSNCFRSHVLLLGKHHSMRSVHQP